MFSIKRRFPCRESLSLGSAGRPPGEERELRRLRCANSATARTATAQCKSARWDLEIGRFCCFCCALELCSPSRSFRPRQSSVHWSGSLPPRGTVPAICDANFISSNHQLRDGRCVRWSVPRLECSVQECKIPRWCRLEEETVTRSLLPVSVLT